MEDVDLEEDDGLDDESSCSGGSVLDDSVLEGQDTMTIGDT